jgi:hypothetical protein
MKISCSLKKLLKKVTPLDRLSNYYLFLAKKYLWNNYNPKMARKNLKVSMKMNPNMSTLLLYFVSFLRQKQIKILYEKLK